MKLYYQQMMLLLLCFFFTLLYGGITIASDSGDATLAGNYSKYKLNAGDLIYINVFNEEDLSEKILLTDAGTISYPFLNEIKAKGLTVSQLASVIETGLKNGYLKNPKVTVSIEKYRNFFVRGEVKKPGGFSFQPGLTLEKAIAMAGGFSARANKNNIHVTRESNQTSISKILSLNQSVQPGDIINIRESFF